MNCLCVVCQREESRYIKARGASSIDATRRERQMSCLSGLVATIILFLYRSSNWQIPNGINFYPDALGQEARFVLVCQGML
jgi:hypothetical protein